MTSPFPTWACFGAVIHGQPWAGAGFGADPPGVPVVVAAAQQVDFAATQSFVGTARVSDVASAVDPTAVASR